MQKSQKIIIEAELSEISEKMFCSCSNLETVILPDTITSIGAYAFYGCVNMPEMTLPDGVTKIGDQAYAYCGELQKINFPESLESIGYNAFFSCDIKSAIFPDSLVSIGSKAFLSCIYLEDVKLNDNIENIGDYAFCGCKKMKITSLPRNLTNIGSYAFEGCTSIESIEIPSGVKTIETSAFANCKSLEKVIINDGVTSIKSKAFDSCTELKQINIPNSIIFIGDQAFSDCTLIGRIVLPDNMTKINALSFSECTKLSSIYIPKTITTVATNAFKNCYFLYINSPKDSPAIEFAKRNNINYIEISENEETGEFDAEISGDVIDNTQDGQEIPITSGAISAIFDSNSVIQIKYKHGNKDVVFNYDIVDKNVAEDNLNSNLSDYDVLMNFDLLDSDGNKVDFSSEDNGGTVTITVPYKAPIKANKVSVYYIKPDGTRVDMNGVYNPNDKTITFTTTHFSYYAIECLDEFGSVVTSNETESADNHIYNRYGYCKDCGDILNGTDAFVSANAVVGGKIAMNFKVALSPEAAADSEARMTFTTESGKVITIPVSEAELLDAEKNIYQFTISLTSTQMDEKITAKMQYSDVIGYNENTQASVLADYSVNQYLNNIQNAEEAKDSPNTKLINVIKSMRTFGAYMDIYSGDNTSDFMPEDLTDKEITVDNAYNAVVEDAVEGVTAKAASLTVNSLIDINVKFNVTGNIEDYTFTVDGKAVQPVFENGVYCIKIAEISPLNYSKMYNVSVTDGQNTMSVKYSALSYVKNKLGDTDQNLVNVCKAMYLYNQEVEAYNS